MKIYLATIIKYTDDCDDVSIILCSTDPNEFERQLDNIELTEDEAETLTTHEEEI